MDVTFANGVSKLIFEPPDSKGTFLLVDTFKNFPSKPTHETTLGDETHKLYMAEPCGFNNTLAEFADDNSPRKIFITEEYAKRVRPINFGEAKFARYIPLRENDTRRRQLEVAFGYVEDKFYRVKKISESFHPVRVVEIADLNNNDFADFDTAQMRQEYYSPKGNFMFAQVDLITFDVEAEKIISVTQPTIYEPERGKFYRVVPVQDFGWNERGFQEIYLNGKLHPVECGENKFHDTNFFKRLRWSKMFGKVLYEKIDENHDAELFRQLMILRGYKNAKDFYVKNNNDYDSMSDAELLGYPADYDGDDLNDLWDLNGF